MPRLSGETGRPAQDRTPLDSPSGTIRVKDVEALSADARMGVLLALITVADALGLSPLGCDPAVYPDPWAYRAHCPGCGPRVGRTLTLGVDEAGRSTWSCSGCLLRGDGPVELDLVTRAIRTRSAA
jgi:hypothetical protein